MRHYSERLPSLSVEVVVVAAADSVVDDEAAVAGGMPCNIPSRHVALRQWTNDVVAEKK
jgi:hypothetical protein